MVKNLVIGSKLIPGRIIILLIVAGLTYLIYPRIASSAAPWLRPSDSSTGTIISPADTAPPAELVKLTSTPAPEKPITVAAQVSSAAATATTVSTTYTATPPTGGTSSTGTPRSTPTNQATADYLNALATADASLNKTATPGPPIIETTTPLIRAATSTLTPQPTSITVVIVTETPTPLNIITVAAEAARATAVATAIGTYTPMPFNWVVPIVITPEPATAVPGNAATATFLVAEATAAAFVYGTPTATPINLWTATPTPFMQPVIGEAATPWIPPSPTPTSLPIPRELVGKILFLSNRSGGPQPLPEPLVYVIDPDGSNLAVLNDDIFYRTALARDIYSVDQRFRTFTMNVDRVYGTKREHELAPAIFYDDYHYKVTEQVTFFGTGDAWDPVWSPTSAQIAFVSNVNRHAEIWTVNHDGSGQRQLTETDEAVFAREPGKNTFIFGEDEENSHPSWSPDGSKIVFGSTRSGQRQIWVMNAGGSNAYSLSTTGHEDWDPVWIKYTDPARVPEIINKFPPQPSPTPGED